MHYIQDIKQINLYFEYSFTRPYPTSSSQTSIKHLDYNLYNKEEGKKKTFILIMLSLCDDTLIFNF